MCFLKIFIRSVLLFLAIVSSGKLYAQKPGQERIDSLLIDSLRHELPKQKVDTNKVLFLKRLSVIYRIHNPDEGIKYAQQGLDVATKLDWVKGIAISNYQLGVCYHYKLLYPKALEYYIKALKIYEGLKNENAIAQVSQAIGMVYSAQEDHTQARDYYSRSLEIYKKLKNTGEAASLSMDIGETYASQGDTANALANYFKAVKGFADVGNPYGGGVSQANMHIGEIYAQRKNYAAAIEYEQKSLDELEVIGDDYVVSANLLSIGNLYLSLIKDNYTQQIPGNLVPAERAARLRKAIGYLERCLELTKTERTLNVQLDCYISLAEAYKLNGDYKKSLEATDNYHAIKDSVFSAENNRKTMQQGIKYEYEKKEALAKLASEKALQRQKLVRDVFGGGFAVVLIFAGVFFNQRNKIKDGKKKSDELLLNILPSEIAEELKSKGSTMAKHYDNVTILFTDFVNFTQVSERMSPQGLIGELDSCFKAFDEITARYNIEKIKTIGDAYLAVCGLPTADPLHAERVVRAANEICEFMHDRVTKPGSSTFEIRVGIHSGSVVAGIVGVKKFQYDIWGDTVNTAARMEQNSEAGKVNISETTYELVKDKFRCDSRGEIEVKGKGMMKMYFISHGS